MNQLMMPILPSKSIYIVEKHIYIIITNNKLLNDVHGTTLIYI